MSLKEKYRPVLQFMKDYATEAGEVWEDGGILHVRATVLTSFERDTIREKVQEVAGDVQSDIDLQIKVINKKTDESATPENTLKRTANRYPA